MPMPLDAPVTILVIDDKPSIVSGLARLLRRDGHTVATAENGNRALALLQERSYDVILCDPCRCSSSWWPAGYSGTSNR